MRKNMTYTPNIRMNNFKTCRSMTICKEKGKNLLSPSLQRAQSNNNEENSLVLFK
jgi:hypothetical protein